MSLDLNGAVDLTKVALRLDLASGAAVRDGFEGVDRTPGIATHTWDLDVHPWPWADGSVAELYSSHFVEHVGDLVAFMNEAHRVLVPGGKLTIRHPYQFSVWAWQDPTHRRALNEYTWSYFDAAQRKDLGLDHYLGATCDFEVTEVLPSTVHPDFGPDKVSEEEFRAAMLYQVNVVYELTVELRKR